MHHRATIEAVAKDTMESLRILVEHCQSPEAGGHTPSDFPLAGLDERSLQRLAGWIEKVDQSEECES